MKIWKWLLVSSLAVSMTMAFTACGGSSGAAPASAGGEAAEAPQEEVAEDTLPFEGDWLELQALKVGVPSGWGCEVEEDESGYASLQIYTTEEYVSYEETATISIYVDQNGNLGGYGADTIKEHTLGRVPESDREGAVFETVDIGGLTFGKAEYNSSISGDNRTEYAYISGNVEYEVGDMPYCTYTCQVSVSGPYAEQQEVIDQVVESIRLNLPAEFDEAKNGRPVE